MPSQVRQRSQKIVDVPAAVSTPGTVDMPNGSAEKRGKQSEADHVCEVQHSFFHMVGQQIMLGMTFVGVLYAVMHVDAFSGLRQYVPWFYVLQHTTHWGRAHAGPRDVCYLASAFIAIISVRAAFQFVSYWVVRVLKPKMSLKSTIRWTEQAWCVLYYGTAAVWGLILLKSQNYGWSAASLWVDFPHYYIDPEVKRYYLTIFAFWLAQIFVIHFEERRKDHWQMLNHHFVTCFLVVGSYVWSYTRIGHLVMILMDSVDVFLALAKCSKYLGVPGWITDGIFVTFLIAWILLRHFLYMYEMIYGAFPALEALEGKCIYDFENTSLTGAPIQCFSKTIHYTFFALALALQAITIMWLMMIVRVVMRVIRGDGAADTRSDSEDN